MDPVLLTTISGYLLLTVAIGLWTAKLVKSGDDFLLAGRQVPWPLLFCTVGATLVGGGFSVGAVGRTYEMGLLLAVAITGGYAQMIFSGFLVAPKFRQARLYTVAGYFAHRFGPRPRLVALVLSLLFSVLVIAAQMAAIGSVLSAILPDMAESENLLKWAIAIGGIIVIVYSAAGGLQAVIYTDVFQFVVLVLGFLLTAVLVAPDLWQAHTTNGLSELPATFFSPFGDKGPVYLVTLFLAFLLGETFAPGYVTRFCSGRSSRDIRIGIGGAGIFLVLVFPAVVFLIGSYARLNHPGIASEQALAVVITSLNHPVVAGLIIAALLSAVMSSADSGLNSTTAIFIKDIIEHYHLGLRQEHADQKRILRWARWATILLGLFSVLIAVLIPQVLELLLFTYHLWAPGIILPILIGTLSTRRSRDLERKVFLTMLLSPIVALGFRFTLWAESFDPAVFGVLFSGFFFVVIGGPQAFYRAKSQSQKSQE